MQETKQALAQITTQAIEKKIFSACSILLGNSKKILFQETYGKLDFAEKSKNLQKKSIFDLASLTKALATSLAIFLLIEKKKITLKTSLANFFSEFQTVPKNQITIFHLLTHTSGLPDWALLFQQKNAKNAWQQLLQTPLINPVGSKVVYSCLGFMLLAKIIEKITGNYQKFCIENFFEPLGLSHTFFYPLPAKVLQTSTIVSCYKEAPSSKKKQKLQKNYGIVQDDNCRIFKGQSGNAGLFSTVGDVYLLAKTLLKNYQGRGRALLQQTSIVKIWQLSTKEKTPHWALGWVNFQGNQEYNHCAKNMEINTVGHLGYTGTSLMIEPQRQRIYIILTNRIGSKKTSLAIKNFRMKTHRLLADFN